MPTHGAYQVAVRHSCQVGVEAARPQPLGDKLGALVDALVPRRDAGDPAEGAQLVEALRQMGADVGVDGGVVARHGCSSRRRGNARVTAS